MRHFINICILVVLRYYISPAQCDGGNPTMDYTISYNFSLTIETNFNAARRWEEINLGLVPNCLGMMDPPPEGWSALTEEEKALYIIQSERTARGKHPLQGMENNLNNIARDHSQWLYETDRFSHTGDPALGTSCSGGIGSNCFPDFNGSCFSQRINANNNIGNCYQTAGENIGVLTGTSDVVSFIIFGMMYDDLACCNWGHRVNFLSTYTDDFGETGTEGFIGIGIYSGSNYQWPFSSGSCQSYYANIITFDLFDPIENSGCNFDPVGPVTCPELLTLSGDISTGEYQAKTIRANGAIASSSSVAMKYEQEAILETEFILQQEAVLTIEQQDCPNTLTGSQGELKNMEAFLSRRGQALTVYSN